MTDPKPSTGEPLSLPESKETLAMQLKQLADGKRSAVFVAEGSPKVFVPRGMNTIPTQEGRIHFNPKFMTADHVRQAVANGRLNDLLGYVQNKTEALDNSLRSGEMPKFVVSRDEDGIEQDAAAVSPDRVHEQAQIFAQRAKPGSKVGIEDSFKTIASREKAFNGGRKKYQDGGTVKEALDLAFRNKNLPQMSDTVLDVPRKAAEMFPFIAKNKPNTKINIRPDSNWAETYGSGETGDPKRPETLRPKEFPMKETGIEIYRPDFSPADYAAEFLHVDPKANRTRDLLTKSLRPDQMDYVKQEGDYEESIRQGQSPKRALQNQIDGMLRGYVMKDLGYLPNRPVRPAKDVFDKQHQQPKSVVEEMKYSPEQKKELEELKSYMTKRACGGPVMHDDTRYALRLANGRQGYADGGAPTMVGASQPMGADPTTQFIRNLANAGFPPEQINAILGSQTQQLPGTQQQAISQQQLMPAQTAPAQMPQQFPLDRQVGRTFRNYGQPADQATIDNIVGRINAGDFSYDQFNDWAKGQYGRPVGGIGTPPPGSEQPIDAKPIVGDGSQPGNPRYYPGGSPIFPPPIDGGPVNYPGGSPIFPPPIDGGPVNLGGQMGGTYGQGNIPFQGQPMPEFLPPGGQMTAEEWSKTYGPNVDPDPRMIKREPSTGRGISDIFTSLQAGQSPMTSTPNYTDPNPADGLRSQSDFQHDLANQIAQLGFPGFGAPQQNQLNAPSQSNALNIANSAIMGQQPSYGAGLIQGGNGGFGPGKDGSGTMAHGPGGAALGSGLKNGPSMASGGYGGFGSGYKNGPSGNFGGGGFMPGGMGGMGFK